MKRVVFSYGLLLVVSLSSAQLSHPATGPSGTVCESEGASCKGIKDGTRLGFKDNCGWYVTCQEDCGCDMKCPEGLHFNKKLQVCDWSTSAGCDASYENLKPGEGPGQGDVPTPGTGNVPWSCPTPGDACIGKKNQATLSYKKDCSKYVVCVDGCETLRDCPAGLHFNSKLNICDWPTSAGCDPSYENVKPGQGNGQGSVPTPGTGNVPWSCPTPGDSCIGKKNLVTHSYENDCSKYVVCMNDCETYKDCPTGLHFNSKLNICDWPTSAGCDPSYGNMNPGQGSVPTPGSGNVPWSCPTPGDSCIRKKNQVTLSYEKDCSKYVVCMDGCETYKDCPAGLHFNSKLNICDWPTSAGCDPSYGNMKPGEGNGQGSVPTPGTGNVPWSCPTPGDSCIGKKNQDTLSYENDCSKYVVCMDGCETYKDCPTGLHFNSKLNICDRPTTAGCDPSYGNLQPGGGQESGHGSGQGSGELTGQGNGQEGESGQGQGNGCHSSESVCFGKTNLTILPHQSDCSKFVVCMDGCESCHECPAGLHFNSKQIICDWPTSAGCDPSIGSLNPGSGSWQQPGSGTGEVGSAAEPGRELGQESGQGSLNCHFPGGLCLGQKNNTILSHKSDCSKYVVCVNGCETYKECPTGMHFSSQLGVCDWPNNAGCSLENGSIGSGPFIPCNGKDDGKLLLLTGSCIKFIGCYKGSGFEFYCNRGLHFDKTNEICALPQHAGCDQTISTLYLH